MVRAKCRRVGSTNHESVGRCGDDRGQISHNDVATFFILDSFDDDVDEIFSHILRFDVK